MCHKGVKEMFTIAICDDENDSCIIIENMLKQHENFSKFEILIYNEGEKLYKDILNSKIYVDLIILDICLKMTDGVDIGKILRLSDSDINIIYISSKSEYAMQLFDIQPINFLIKPVNKDKLLKNVDVAINLLKTKNNFLEFKSNQQYVKIPYKNILYLESYSKKVHIYCINNEYQYTGKLVELFEKLPKDIFIRIHNSFIVNWLHVSTVNFDKLIIDNGKQLMISRGYKNIVKDFYMESMEV